MTRRFRDRAEAGRELAAALPDDLPGDVVVVGLARGGVEVAAEVAARLRVGLDALAVRKVGHPLQPEYALGAVAPGADDVYVRSAEGLSEAELTAVVDAARRAAAALDERLHAAHPRARVAGRTVLLVDDGLATGATMVAAVRWARGEGAARVVVAVPVAASSSVEALRRQAEVVCPHELDDLGAVGIWYERFDQVTDAEVVALLAAAGPAT